MPIFLAAAMLLSCEVVSPTPTPTPEPTPIPQPTPTPEPEPTPSPEPEEPAPQPQPEPTPEPIPAPSKYSSLNNTANLSSGVGLNLAHNVSYGTDALFVDVFMSARPWLKAGVWDTNAAVDSMGWPTEPAHTVLLDNRERKAGTYIVTWSGSGSISVGGAATNFKVLGPGRAQFDMPTGSTLADFKVNSVPVTQIRIVHQSDEATAWNRFADPMSDVLSGKKKLFNPKYLELHKTSRAFRFMDLGQTNGSPITGWASRPGPQTAIQTSKSGIAIEYMIALSNLVGADPWYCLPHAATDDYVAKAADLFASSLNPGLKVYVEYSNETWNGIFSQAKYVQDQGLAQKLSTVAWDAGRYFHAKRSKEVGQTFKTKLGARAVTVLGVQSAGSWWTNKLLSEGKVVADAFAIAPYFGGELGTSGTVSGWTPDQVMAEIEKTSLPKALATMQANAALTTKYGIQMLGYEGGQHLVGVGSYKDTLADLFMRTNSHPRMKAAYERYLSDWRAAGGGLMMLFSNVGPKSKHGSWGMLEYLSQPVAEAPKWTAMTGWMGTNPCWWVGCVRN